MYNLEMHAENYPGSVALVGSDERSYAMAVLAYESIDHANVVERRLLQSWLTSNPCLPSALIVVAVCGGLVRKRKSSGMTVRDAIVDQLSPQRTELIQPETPEQLGEQVTLQIARELRRGGLVAPRAPTGVPVTNAGQARGVLQNYRLEDL